MIYDKEVSLYNCWGFVDGTVCAIYHLDMDKRVLYNGHKRYCALKFQSVVATSCLIANIYGTVKHDISMFKYSAFLNQLQKLSFGQNQRPLSIYGDPA